MRWVSALASIKPIGVTLQRNDADADPTSACSVHAPADRWRSRTHRLPSPTGRPWRNAQSAHHSPASWRPLSEPLASRRSTSGGHIVTLPKAVHARSDTTAAMPRGSLEVADVPTWRRARAGHLSLGLTAALGGHVAACEKCGHTHIAYNSCRNRHCPKCQGAAAKDWLAARQAELLPVEYYHVVFTLPAPIADIAYHNKAVIYGILFKAAAETLITIARDPKHLGARIGLIGFMDTWGRRADLDHPHLRSLPKSFSLACDAERILPPRKEDKIRGTQQATRRLSPHYRACSRSRWPWLRASPGKRVARLAYRSGPSRNLAQGLRTRPANAMKRSRSKGRSGRLCRMLLCSIS